jgi:hypothetical protein
MYFHTRTSRISEKKRKNLLFGCIRHLVCLGNERLNVMHGLYKNITIKIVLSSLLTSGRKENMFTYKIFSIYSHYLTLPISYL